MDPPNGQLPDRTPAAEALRERQSAERRAQRQALGGVEANSYTDRSNYDRCISLGPMGSLTPKIYNPRDDDYGFYEYACHEGNYTMFNILSGARAE